jgi:hypothetical protein
VTAARRRLAVLRAKLAINPAATAIDLVIVLFIAWVDWPLPGDIRRADVAGIVGGVVVLGLYAFLLRVRLAGRAPSLRRERAALLAAARKMRHHDMWLNRDEHVGLMCTRGLMRVEVDVFVEDDVRAVQAGESGTFVMTTYKMLLLGRLVGGVAVTAGPDGGIEVAEEDSSRRQRLRRGWRLLVRTDLRLLAPDRDELAQVVRWLAGAELVGNMDDPDGDGEDL